MPRSLRLALAALCVAPSLAAAGPASPPAATAAPQSTPATEALAQQALADLRARLDELERRTTSLTALAVRIEELDRKLGELAAAQRGETETRPATVRAITTLSREVRAVEAELLALSVAEKAAPLPGHVGWDDGLWIAAGDFRLTLHGALQARYVGEVNVGYEGASSFDVHHAWLALEPAYGRWLAGRVSIDLSSNYFPGAAFAETPSLLRDAYLDVKPTSWLTVRAGQFYVPLGRQRQILNTRLADIERNAATLAFTPPRDLGAMITVAPWGGRVALSAAVSDGEAGGVRVSGSNANLDVRYTGRLLIAPLGPVPLVEGDPTGRAPPRFSVGVAASYDLVPTNDPTNIDRNGDGVRDNVGVTTAAGEVAATWRELSLQGEYFLRREQYGGRVADKRFEGFYVQAQVTVVPRWLMLAAHLVYAEPHLLGAPGVVPGMTLPRGGVLADALVPLDLWDMGGTATAFWRSHDVKLQLGYRWRRSDLPSGVSDSHLVEVQATLGF